MPKPKWRYLEGIEAYIYDPWWSAKYQISFENQVWAVRRRNTANVFRVAKIFQNRNDAFDYAEQRIEKGT